MEELGMGYFSGIASGTNGDSPHGMARYGTEWRKVEPVDGVLTVPGDTYEFFMVSGGGGASGGGPSTAMGGPGMSDDSDEFTIDGETYFWGRKVGAADFGMVPEYPPETSELVLEWDRSTPEWEIAIGKDKR